MSEGETLDGGQVLAGFARSDAYFERSPAGALSSPMLALLLVQALEAQSSQGRERGMQRLGDVALFTVGFFAHGFSRKLVDVDNFIAMGGNAYGSLADTARSSGLNPLRPVFAELAVKFIAVMDTLHELSDVARPLSVNDPLRFYEIWLKTGSTRAQEKLTAMGISPVTGGSLRSRQ